MTILKIIEKEVTIKFTNDDLKGLFEDMEMYEDICEKVYLNELYQLVGNFLKEK